MAKITNKQRIIRYLTEVRKMTMVPSATSKYTCLKDLTTGDHYFIGTMAAVRCNSKCAITGSIDVAKSVFKAMEAWEAATPHLTKA